VRDRRLAIAVHLEEVRADGVEAAVAGQQLVEALGSARPAAGPSTIAAATARMSITIGLPVIRPTP
jgi:hypothetical protein